ncbi:helix-turn-helix domain-containing protein [Clostridium sp. Marseille-Q2269]|uniref:helix-turn-helix domain-containing protein n=1 Tax=Clostridium sp. Marseille-Q2269 TaxID=2942205 RepID=UPI002073ABE2|nr:helix-turn-helix domain-containing protein [Clostridium sp. Marseille-Q2269]
MELSNRELLADMLISAREDKGYSQRHLAHITGVSNSEISKLEKAQRLNPNLKILKKLGDALDIKYEEILEILGYIKSNYSFKDNTSLLTNDEKEYIINTLTSTWENDIKTKINFKDKDSIRELLFGDIESSMDNFDIEKDMPEIANILTKNKHLLSEKKYKKKLYELISWYIDLLGGEK